MSKSYNNTIDPIEVCVIQCSPFSLNTLNQQPSVRLCLTDPKQVPGRLDPLLPLRGGHLRL
jgi:hypothetical protein